MLNSFTLKVFVSVLIRDHVFKLFLAVHTTNCFGLEIEPFDSDVLAAFEAGAVFALTDLLKGHRQLTERSRIVASDAGAGDVCHPVELVGQHALEFCQRLVAGHRTSPRDTNVLEEHLSVFSSPGF